MSSAELSTLICTIFICTTFLLLFSITTSNFIFTYIDTIITRESLKLYTLSNNIITKSSPPPPPPPPPSPPPPTPSPPLRPLSPPPPPFLYSSEPSPPLASLLQAQSLLSPLPGSLLSPPPLLSPPQPLLSPPPPLRKEDSNDSDLFRLPTNVNKLPSPSPEPSMPPQLSSLSPSFTQPPLTQPPPQLLEDDEDDKKLFHLASKVNSTPTHGAPQKLAFLFLTTSPLPFAPLWELYFLQNQTQHPNKNLFNIYIHADPSYPYNPPFSGIFSNRTISSSKPTQRGSPSLISAARRLLADALLHDPSNARFIIISTSCIPIHSFNFTYTTLFNTNKSFIEILKNEPKIFNRYISRGGVNQMLPEVPFDEFRVGSQFFVLNRHHARLIVKDEKVWSKFRLPCVKPKFCYPEEHYFSTLLNMEDSTSCIPATLTHVDWSLRLGSHPRTYKESDIGVDLIKSIRERKIRYGNGGVNGSEVEHHYPFLFARKFSPRCLKPLIGIANDFLF